MRPTRTVLRTPLIKFLGKRRETGSADHTPRVHPESPETALPSSFAFYRANATTHGPLGGKGTNVNKPFVVADGELFLRSQLPARYQYKTISETEIENVMLGGADVVY